MRKSILTLIAVLGLFTISFAQGNLQFNQVILHEFTANFGGWSINTTSTITVPAGKVWKIEHCEAWTQSTMRSSTAGSFSLYLGNTIVKHYKGTTEGLTPDRFPIWLPAGTYDVIISNENSGTYTYVGTISAIEFNVIP